MDPAAPKAGWSVLRSTSMKAPTADAAAPRAAGIATTAASPEWKAPVRAVTETALAVCDDPVTITFKHLSFHVPVGGQWTTILRNVTGSCRAARLTACMGPSGAGKSTLLKILACAIPGGAREGDLMANGQPIVPAEFRRRSSVVWQSDVLLPCATVREAIMTCALLQLPQSMPRAAKARRVDQILTELELQRVANSRIGQDIDGAATGISGGERRRVSVGIGLVTDAAVLFLDEPTTGLDSDSAGTLVTLLSHLAVAKKRTVVCTIHQPSSDICELFDDLLLLAAGRVLYCGRWRGVDAHLAAAGMPRPAHRSTAEHILTVCKDPDAVSLLATLSDDGLVATAQAHTLSRTVSRAGAAAAAAAAAAANAPSTPTATFTLTGTTPKLGSRQPSLAAAEGGRANCSLRTVGEPLATAAGGHHAPPPATSTAYQVAVLSVRFLRSWARTPALAGVQLAQYLFFAILLGATYWRLGDHAARDGAAAGVFDRVASLWFVVLCCVLQPGANACTIMYGQKALLRREAGGGLYRTRAFFVAKSLTSLPFQLLFAAVFNAIIYFCVGYQATAAKFAVFFGVNLLAMLVSESLGVLAAALHRSELIGQIMLSLLFVPLLMYTGFIQTRSPPYLAWLKKLSFAAYAYAALVKNEFGGLQLPPVRGAPPAPADRLIPKNIDNGLTIAADVGVLLGFLVSLRLVGFGLFAHAVRSRRL